jgi:hypothetical protein
VEYLKLALKIWLCIWLAQQANNQGLPAVVCVRLSLGYNDDLRRGGLQT